LAIARHDVGQRSETVRRSNLSAILRELHARGPVSRSELVVSTGLTRSAIRALIGELASAGLVSEERATSLGTPGRPSPIVRPDPDAVVAVAVEISVDSLAVAIVGLGGRVHELERVDRSRAATAPDAVIADVVDLVRAVRDRRPADDRVIGIGLAVAGVVRRTDGFVSMAPNLGWVDLALGERLAEALDTTTPILIANEADLGALAEHRRGAAVGYRDVLYISGEVGVGAGIIVDGRPLTGALGYGGEVGHIPLNPDGRPCRCGSIGCWETEAGEEALLRLAGYPPDGGRDAIDAVVRDAEAGIPQALAALERTGRWLGIGLAGLINVFDPRLVVLGGLFGRTYRFVMPAVRDELARRALPALLALVEVVPARLGIDAPLLGAAELALEPLLADPAAWIGRRGSASVDAETSSRRDEDRRVLHRAVVVGAGAVAASDRVSRATSHAGRVPVE
jgi:predicted NBD/HSP70 family sugar kinase